MGPSRLARADIGGISGRHAGYQLGRQEQFKGLAISSKLAESAHAANLMRARQTDRGQALGERRLAFQQAEFGKNLRQEKSGLTHTILSGLAGSAFGVMEGRRRKKLEEQSVKDQQRILDYITTNTDARRSAQSGRTDEGALLAARSLIGRRFF
jgi:hypothetical protein